MGQATSLLRAWRVGHICQVTNAVTSRTITRIKATVKEKKIANFSNASQSASPRVMNLLLSMGKLGNSIITYNPWCVNQ
jgi:aspartate aminotransferase-like enzyme